MLGSILGSPFFRVETYFIVLLSLSGKTKHSPAETLYIVGLGVVAFGAD